MWSFDLRNPENRSLICEEKAPVLKVSGLKLCILNFGRNKFIVRRLNIYIYVDGKRFVC